MDMTTWTGEMLVLYVICPRADGSNERERANMLVKWMLGCVNAWIQLGDNALA